jgi:hypothetical protein
MDDHILEWSSALEKSIINNPTFDVVNDEAFTNTLFK